MTSCSVLANVVDLAVYGFTASDWASYTSRYKTWYKADTMSSSVSYTQPPGLDSDASGSDGDHADRPASFLIDNYAVCYMTEFQLLWNVHCLHIFIKPIYFNTDYEIVFNLSTITFNVYIHL